MRSSSPSNQRGWNGKNTPSTTFLLVGLVVAFIVMITDDIHGGIYGLGKNNNNINNHPFRFMGSLVAAEPQQQEEEVGTSTGEDQHPDETSAYPSEESLPKRDKGPSNSDTKADFQDDPNFDVKTHTNWGTYYDPKNIFCGKYDCYTILGFDYESFGKARPDTKIITKRYRALSRHWHPDKSKHRDAKERFVKIARAYEVLTNFESRKEYDALRYDQLAYFRKYGANVLWSYAPQSNTGLVIVFILLVLNGFVYFAQYNKWKNVADRLAKAAVEDWNPSQGGTIESRELRDHAAKIWQEREDLIKKQATANGGAGSASSSAADSSNKKLKLAAREKKQKQNEELKPIIQKLAYDIHDFGAGFHKPTWKDLLVVRMVHWPYHIVLGIGWQVQFYIRRIQNLEWTDEEKTVMTERAVGHVTWELSSEQDRSDMIQRELWILPNLVEWKEQQEIKKLSKSHQKHIAKMKKKGVPLKDE